MQNNQVRLNYSIPGEVAENLQRYCGVTCRTASNVVRQLILEYIEGDRQAPDREFDANQRTTLALTQMLLDAFDDTARSGRRTKGEIISSLLYEFLSDGGVSDFEFVPLTVSIPRVTYDDLVRHSVEVAADLEDLVVSATQDLVSRIAAQYPDRVVATVQRGAESRKAGV